MLAREAEVTLNQGRLIALRERLSDAHLGRDLGEEWEHGVPRGFLSDLLADWRAFDTTAFQHRLRAQQNLTVDVDGLRIHVVHSAGRGAHPVPLLLTHGWPGSFLEFADLIPYLTDPVAHGGAPEEAFTVVAPSLPGYGFSDSPPAPGLSGRQIATLWSRVMQGLGYERYVAHGTDLGAGVTAWLARNHADSVLGIHLATPGLTAPADQPTETETETRFASEVADWSAAEGGYMHEQATKPATLGAGLSDSPAGLAAWIAEKIVAWSSTRPDGSPAFPRTRLLETLTLYWATDTITTSLLPYWMYRNRADAKIPAGSPPPAPTAISIFGGERVPFPKPPRELAERYYNVSSWTEHDRGGHFPAIAEPQLLASELRAAFASVRAGRPRGDVSSHGGSA